MRIWLTPKEREWVKSPNPASMRLGAPSSSAVRRCAKTLSSSTAWKPTAPYRGCAFINPILLWFARSNHDDLVRQGQLLHLWDAAVARPQEFPTPLGEADRVGRTQVSGATMP